MSNLPEVVVVGGGLAGCEVAHQLSRRGVRVRLHEMKPAKRTPAQTGDGLAELVCSNSMRGAALENAVGLLKEEMRRAGSLVIRCADATRVPAGGALAVDRERFSEAMTRAIGNDPMIELVSGEVASIPTDRPAVLATGPLTSDLLAADLERLLGGAQLAYYDAIAPIISADSLDWSKVWKQSRYDKGTEDGCEPPYVNCGMSEPEYMAFVVAMRAADKVEPRAFEKAKYFEGCLPCEVMAERGDLTLAYGPMKPVGLTDPRTGRRPFAVVQLRPEDAAATAYNLVGFQTRMKQPEQLRVMRMIPGLEEAEFLRFGAVHRNTFVHAPSVLDETLQVRASPGLYLAGQMTGVEGYVESAATGLLVGRMLAERLLGQEVRPPPPTTAFGGLLTHTGRNAERYQPSNITWACVPPLDGAPRKLKKRARYAVLAERALVDLESWLRRTEASPGDTLTAAG